MAAETGRQVTGRVAFLPWLVLRGQAQFGDVRFVPLREDRRVSADLADLPQVATKILASYRTLDGEGLQNCTFVLHRGLWNVKLSDRGIIEAAVQALFLASMSANEYVTQGDYANWSMFELVVQEFDDDASDSLTILSRRRDGSTRSGGYTHGNVVFSQPPQCAGNTAVAFEADVLSALHHAAVETTETFPLIKAALGFMVHAMTDSFTGDETSELIATATAFEQLFDANADKRRLATRFGDVFAPYARRQTQDALRLRPDIYIEKEYEAAQRQWPVHKKWLHELYQVRSKAAHRRGVETLPWGWNLEEHLLMGAWVFPLAVKLRLAADGHYTMTQSDRARCASVDHLLVETEWTGRIMEGEWAGRHLWLKIVSNVRDDEMWNEVDAAVVRDLLAQPDLENGGETE